MDRDIAEEARSWRDSTVRMQRNPEVIEALTREGSEDRLIAAYRLWWNEYSGAVRRAPSNRSSRGISKEDARAAGATADGALLRFFEG